MHAKQIRRPGDSMKKPNIQINGIATRVQQGGFENRRQS